MKKPILIAAFSAVALSGLLALAEEPPPAGEAAPAVEPAPDASRDNKQDYWDLIGRDDPNPSNYEFAFVAVGIQQNWGIATWKGGGFYFGAAGMLGPPLYRISKMDGPDSCDSLPTAETPSNCTRANGAEGVNNDGKRDVGFDPTLEIITAMLYLRIAPFEYLDIDVGGRIGLGGTSFGIDDAPGSAFVKAGYVDIRVGSKNIKVGPRLEYDEITYSDFNETGWKITPLMLRVKI